MRDKVSRHQRMRGPEWHTIEEPLDLAPALAAVECDDVVLLDCATMWLSNHILADNDLDKAGDSLMAGLLQCLAPMVVVSNEVGLSVVPENALARRFRQAQGELNQKLAERADLVINVIAGLPQVLKGNLP